MATIDLLKKIRLEKLEKLKSLRVNPYPPTATQSQVIKKAREMLGQEVAVVGRLMGLRGHGKILFADLVDESGKIQVVFKHDVVNPTDFKLVELLDIGDFVAVQGEVFKTQAGEISVNTNTLQLLSKSIHPLPDKWYGLKDIEERYRERYLDLILNPKVKEVLDKRWSIERYTREFLWKEGYKEVETPVLQPLYGGTNARPFTTHMNSLDSDFYLRVAPELYLKRLIVGGYERVFEIARNFRNEGIDLTHQPEFTMIEWYEAYADYQRIMDMTEELFKFLAQKVNGITKLKVDDHDTDIGGKWRRITIDAALKEYEGIEWETVTDENIKLILEDNDFKVPGAYSRNKALFEIYDHLVTPKLIEPTWVIDYPREVSPLSKEHRSKEGRVERFEGYIGGKEICDGWSEIVSAQEQRERFEQEQKNMKAGDVEAHPLDEDFLTALEYGCPPLGGIGIGIDRLVMFLTNTWAIREVIAFPTLRPLTKNSQPEVKNQPDKKDTNQESLRSDSEQARTKNQGGQMKNNFTRDQALELLHSKMQNQNLRKHCYAVAAVMRALYFKLNDNESADAKAMADKWEIAGTLHDADYEITKDNAKTEHVHRVVSWLKEKGVDEEIINAIFSHGWKFVEDCPEPSSKFGWALYTCDELTGLITACALVRPEKKMSAVALESVQKKWNQKAFAAGVNRDQIALCEEKLGIPLPEFIQTALSAMQGISIELGL